MKKIIFIALFIIFVVGCSKKEAPKPTLLEIMSSSCSMCKEMKPIIAKVQEKYEGMISFLIYDTDTTAGAEQANLYAIKKIPTLIFIDKQGNEYFRSTSKLNEDMISAILNTQLKNEKK